MLLNAEEDVGPVRFYVDRSKSTEKCYNTSYMKLNWFCNFCRIIKVTEVYKMYIMCYD